MADLFPESESSLKAKLQSAVQRLAAINLFIGTAPLTFLRSGDLRRFDKRYGSHILWSLCQ